MLNKDEIQQRSQSVAVLRQQYRFCHGLAHVVIPVRDVARAATFYREVLKLEPIGDPTAEWAWFWAGVPGQQRLGLHKGPLTPGAYSPQMAGVRAPTGPSQGAVYVSFKVPADEVAEGIKCLREHKVTVHGPVRNEKHKALCHYFYDPDGNLLELWTTQVLG